MIAAPPGPAVPPLAGRGISQVAYAVADIHAAARRHSAVFGSGPWFCAEHVALASARAGAGPASGGGVGGGDVGGGVGGGDVGGGVGGGGAPAWLDHSSAYGQWGPVMVELICIHDAGPEPVATALRAGRPGLHHVARMVPHLDDEAGALEAAGLPEVLRATTRSGVTFAFHDGGDLGHLLEIYDAASLAPFYRRVAEAARDWDGSAVVRAMSEVPA